ncbi:MAG: hypothetical protein JJLCMIEE_00529 [Acidimicrobiales bacterium]|nr:MAG: acyl-CoA dehydrogenase [Actinomycetota bacterium]MBV6507481.1 hypothetical protein [Acidimicrobiales bacterium]RIK07858.1 MAG: hypothetical protein DCC48_02595 [Acidobacteriota bacterium]
MDFTLTDEQELLQQTARALLENECPSTLVRAHMQDPSAVDPLWDKHLRDWVALADGELVDLCLFLTETGAVIAPGPYFATAALFAPLIKKVDRRLHDAVIAGEATGTVAMAGPEGEWTISSASKRTFVPEADRVDYVAVVLPGPRVLVTGGLPARQMETIDTTRRVFEIEVPRDAATPVEIDEADLTDLLERATVALAAELIGTARWLLDSTVAYTKERIQFDRPVGSFQGLQWKMVDMALDYERAAAAVSYAAMAIDAADPERHRAAHVAKAAAGRAALHCARGGLQCHGGIGYTWEHDLHLYLRRAYASEYLLGSVDWHLDRLAELLID